MTSAIRDLAAHIEDVPGFPREGILFRDISPLLRDRLDVAVRAMLDLFAPQELEGVRAFVGLDARGFIFAPAMAVLTGKGFIMARKGGKLPEPLFATRYNLEYGSAALEIKPGEGRVVIVDDVLATGGTLGAAAELCVKAGYEVSGFATLINLQFLNDFEWNGLTCRSVLHYNENGLIEPSDRLRA